MTEYNYTKAVVCIPRLWQEIIAANLESATLENITYESPDSLNIFSDIDYSGADETALNGVVSAHTGEGLTEYPRFCETCANYFTHLGISAPTICPNCSGSNILTTPFGDGCSVKPNLRSPDTSLWPMEVDDDGTPSVEGETISISSFYAYNIMADAGTFNSVDCNAAGLAVLSDRWDFRGFTAGNDDNCVCQLNAILPQNYRPGTDIKIKINFSYLDASGGTIVWGCGVTRDSNVYADDDSTEYITNDFTAGITSDWNKNSYEFTIDGTDFVKGDLLAVIIYRDTTNGNNDTLGSTVYLNQVEILN